MKYAKKSPNVRGNSEERCGSVQGGGGLAVLEASFKGCLGSMFMSPAFKWSHSLLQAKVHVHPEGTDLMHFIAPVAGFQCSDVDKRAALLGGPAV